MGVIGDIVGAGATLGATAMQNKANMKLAEYQYSKDLEMWNRANDYNSPSNQMKRLQDAGINPNLAYSSGSLQNQASGNLPKYNAPTVSYDQVMPQVAGMLQTFADLDMKQAQTDKIKEESLAVRNSNEMTAIQKQYWAQNAFNDAKRKYNEGVITARQLDRITREIELDFNGKLNVNKETGDYNWEFGENSYARMRRELELDRYSKEAVLTKFKTDFQEWYNKFVKKYKWAGLALQGIGMFR